jgi:hypothetical protein
VDISGSGALLSEARQVSPDLIIVLIDAALVKPKPDRPSAKSQRCSAVTKSISLIPSILTAYVAVLHSPAGLPLTGGHAAQRLAVRGMSNYLIVAHQTANSPEVIELLQAIGEQEPDARFVLLVPATPVQELRRPVQDDSRSNAERVATRALYALHESGVRLDRVSVGDASPLLAIQQELATHPDYYREIVLCTLPVDFSRWLDLDIPEKVRTTFGLPVTHLHGWARTEE